MHAKIMMLSPPSGESDACRWAEQILIEISAAFDHVFSLLQGKADDRLSEHTLAACQSCQAVFVWSADIPGLSALYDEFALPAAYRRCALPPALCGRRETPFSLTLAQALSLDRETLESAFAQAGKLHLEAGGALRCVSPTGPSAALWTEAANRKSAHALTGPEAIRRLIAAPQETGLCLCPPYAGGMLFAAAAALYGDRCLISDFAFDGGVGIYAPLLSAAPGSWEDHDACCAALAVSFLLRFSLGLHREADCVSATLQNALSAGSRPGQETIDSICDQISVAGALMGKSGLSIS